MRARVRLSGGERLLLAGVGAAAHRDELGSLARDPGVDWGALARAARWHRVPGLVWRGLREAGVSGLVPGAVAAELERSYLDTLARNMVNRAEVARLSSALAGAGVPVVLLKGAALMSTGVYDDPGLREMCDLDLLLAADDIGRGEEVMGALGYRPVPGAEGVASDGRHAAPLVRGDGMVTVELHRHLGGLASGVDLGGVWSRARARPAGTGRSVGLAPAPEDLLMHVGLHFLGNRLYRSQGALAQVCDMARIMEAADAGMEWELVVREAGAGGYGAPLAVALAVVKSLTGTGPPPEVVVSLAPGDVDDDLVESLVRRRVLRTESWLPLEFLGAGKHPVRRLLPARTTMATRLTGTGGASLVALAGAYARRVGAGLRLVAGAAAHPADVARDLTLNRRLRSLPARPRS